MFYFINVFYPTLPWFTCDNWWNTDTCIGPVHDNGTELNSTVPVSTSDVGYNYDNATVFLRSSMGNLTLRNVSRTGFSDKTAAEEFWQYVHYLLTSF